jgi:hypothetical protein
MIILAIKVSTKNKIFSFRDYPLFHILLIQMQFLTLLERISLYPSPSKAFSQVTITKFDPASLETF